MTFLIMALSAMKLAVAVEPYIVGAFEAIWSLVSSARTKGTLDPTEAAKQFERVVQLGAQALLQVQSLTFVSHDTVANAIGQWQSAFRTVQDAARAEGIEIDAAGIHTAMDLASHKVQVDSPLDAITPTDALGPIPILQPKPVVP